MFLVFMDCSEESHTLTQAVEAQSTVVEEEADVSSPRWHAAEGVSAAGCQRVNAAGEQEGQQRPGEGVLPRSLNQHHRHQFPQEVPAGRDGQGKVIIWSLDCTHCTVASLSYLIFILIHTHYIL